MNKFCTFTGVVEDRHDPEKVGRVRVRCLGLHSESKTDLPTEDLPWAQPMLPTTAGGISGLGQSPTFLVHGTWVFGYFRDGDSYQQPVILGVLPGRPSEYSSRWYSKAFYDGDHIYPKYINESDTNRLATGETNLVNEIRTATRITNVATADFDAQTAADGSTIAGSDTTIFSQPPIRYNAVYPYNKVTETESGHILEFDDTPMAERIHLRHKTGNSLEWDVLGDQVNLVKGNDHTYVVGHNYHYIEGSSDITIDGHHKIYINKSATLNNHYDIQVGANASINIQVDDGDVNVHTVKGKINMNAGGDYNLKVGGNYTVSVAGNTSETIEGTKTSNTTGAVIHRGSTIDLNP